MKIVPNQVSRLPNFIGSIHLTKTKYNYTELSPYPKNSNGEARDRKCKEPATDASTVSSMESLT